MVKNIDFRTQKITELFAVEKIRLTKCELECLAAYYINSYDRVYTNIIEDELVGFEYHNLCTIEKIIPNVKELKMLSNR